MKKQNSLQDYPSMEAQAKMFYQERVGITLDNEELTRLAVQSITLPGYMKEFNDYYETEIYSLEGLATVGDAALADYLMKAHFKPHLTKAELTQLKEKLTNEELASLGEELFGDFLFSRNTDLNKNKQCYVRAYATALEAVFGFLTLKYPRAFNEIAKKIG